MPGADFSETDFFGVKEEKQECTKTKKALLRRGLMNPWGQYSRKAMYSDGEISETTRTFQTLTEGWKS